MYKAKRFNLLRGIFFYLRYRIIIFAALKMFCKSVNILMAGRIRSTSSMSESLIRFFFFPDKITYTAAFVALISLMQREKSYFVSGSSAILHVPINAATLETIITFAVFQDNVSLA